MFRDLEIQRFRLFEDLRIERLSRINLFGGRNNSGKTTLLEALFLLSGVGEPELLDRILGFRGIHPALSPFESVVETHWLPLFSGFETEGPISIRGETSDFGSLVLTIGIERRGSVEVRTVLPGANGGAFGQSDSAGLEPTVADSRSLGLAWEQKGRQPVKGRITSSAKGLQFEAPLESPPFVAFLVTHRTRSLQMDASRLGGLRTRKMGGRLTEALRVIEPRLQGVEDSVAGGIPMIWGDIGLPRLLPLAAMGEGLATMTSLLLNMSEAENGVVLVDEIEHGLHHSVLKDLWRVVDRASREFNTQVIATTHSYECLAAAQEVFGEAGDSNGEDFLFQRLERTREGGMRSMLIELDRLATAIRHGMEVR